MTHDSLPIRTFDPNDEYFVQERRDLPHWAQARAIAFITWRTWDSIPKPVYVEWLRTRAAWLRRHGIDPDSKQWRNGIEALSRADQIEFRQLLAERWETALDECHGA